MPPTLISTRIQFISDLGRVPTRLYYRSFRYDQSRARKTSRGWSQFLPLLAVYAGPTCPAVGAQPDHLPDAQTGLGAVSGGNSSRLADAADILCFRFVLRVMAVNLMLEDTIDPSLGCFRLTNRVSVCPPSAAIFRISATRGCRIAHLHCVRRARGGMVLMDVTTIAGN